MTSAILKEEQVLARPLLISFCHTWNLWKHFCSYVFFLLFKYLNKLKSRIVYFKITTGQHESWSNIRFYMLDVIAEG